jgi:8-oxo-dGTP pyrophosphatase MutT (NUDIX family)
MAKKQATLCIITKGEGEEREILLAMKKRRFGVGKWNAAGGKMDKEKGDKSILDTAIRETKEEVGVKVKDLEKVAVLSFHFPYIPKENEWDQDVHVFFAKNWEGKPKETEEMAPRWFRLAEIPFSEMWDDDKFWLPEVLQGKKVRARFIFKKGEIIDKHIIEPADKL